MPDRAFIHRPFDEHLFMKPTGVGLFKLAGEVGDVNLGNYENASITISSEPEDIWSPQTPERTKVATIHNDISVTVNLTLQQLVPVMRTVIMQSTPGLLLNQPAVLAEEFTIAGLGAGRVFPLPHRNLTAVSCENADGDPYVEGVNFQYDAATGCFEIIVHPGDVERDDVVVTYSAAAIADRKLYGIASEMDLRGGFMFRSTNRHGPKQQLTLWDMGAKGDGEIVLGANSTDQASIPIVGTAYADPSKPVAFQYGEALDLL